MERRQLFGISLQKLESLLSGQLLAEMTKIHSRERRGKKEPMLASSKGLIISCKKFKEKQALHYIVKGKEDREF